MTAVLDWLRQACSTYVFEARGVFVRESVSAAWPLTASTSADLEQALAAGGHLLPLPSEPAALANIIEVSLADYLMRQLAKEVDALCVRGSERGYPDLEFQGGFFGGGFHAVDIKAAKRHVRSPRARANYRPRTKSRITLYTGNTYFKWQELHWPNTFRPFGEYSSHVTIVALYDLVETSERVQDLQLIVQPTWKIASRQRSSTTREYIGAVDGIEALENGDGEFADIDSFYRYWKRFPFDVSPQVQNILRRLMNEQRLELEGYRQQAADLQQPLT